MLKIAICDDEQPYVAVQLFLHDSGMVKSIFYGNSMVMNSSRQSTQ